jgi:hypothetical protein
LAVKLPDNYIMYSPWSRDGKKQGLKEFLVASQRDHSFNIVGLTEKQRSLADSAIARMRAFMPPGSSDAQVLDCIMGDVMVSLRFQIPGKFTHADGRETMYRDEALNDSSR